MFKIGDFSKLAQVSVKTLRYYAQLGLLKPVWVDRYSGYRYYALEQLPRLNRILTLKDLGFSLEQIQKMLGEELALSDLRAMLRLKESELERQLQEEQARLERIQARLRQIEQEGASPAYEVVLKRVEAQHVAGVRRVLPDISHLGGLFGELYGLLKAQGLRAETAIPPLAVYFDADYHEQDIDVEATLPLSRRLPASLSLLTHELPRVESMAAVLHQGSYSGLGQAYRCLLTWAEANNYRITAAARELYLRGIQSDAVCEQWITEVQLPVQKKPIPVFISQQKEKNKMEPTIVTKPAFKAVGMFYTGKNENQEIAQLWGQFNPRIQEIQDISDGAFGLCKPSDESGVFQYLACMAVKDCKDIPEGMEVWEVSEQKYVVIPCTLPTIHEAYRYAFETWIPQSGYEYSRGIDYEYYDETFDPNIEGSQLYIYIPIK